MEKIIFKGAINPLSFGNVSYNLLKAMYKKEMHVAFFPISENLNFEAFDKIEKPFHDWVVDIAQNRFHLMDKDIPTFSQWHLNGSESRISKHQTLLTFYESDEPTPVETAIASMQDNCVFSSKHAADCFIEAGCNNVHHVPIGFDDDFETSDEDYLPDQIHFGLMGKFENRKNTAQILNNWAQKYGNNDNYQLSCCISNPFFKPEDLNALISKALNNQVYSNINFIPHLKTNSEVNEFINAIDIDLTGLSGAEGWNLPSFNATALGKWSIVMNHTSHKDWANNKNCILVEPEEKVEIYDSAFFHKGTPFNQGHMHKISDEKMIDCFEKSEKFYGKKNNQGVKLQKEFTYEKTLTKILEIIKT